MNIIIKKEELREIIRLMLIGIASEDIIIEEYQIQKDNEEDRKKDISDLLNDLLSKAEEYRIKLDFLEEKGNDEEFLMELINARKRTYSS